MPNFEEHIKKAADRYVAGIERGGLQPSETLVKAMIERAQQDYKKQLVEEHLDNVDAIMRTHNERENEIKRSGARLRAWSCPLIAAWFGALAWYSFIQQQPRSAAIIMGIVYIVGALAFLLMLILGAIFDRPKSL